MCHLHSHMCGFLALPGWPDTACLLHVAVFFICRLSSENISIVCLLDSSEDSLSECVERMMGYYDCAVIY